MKRLLKNVAVLAVCLIVLLVSGCGDEHIDGKLVKLDDGRVIELQWRIGDCYLAHEIDKREIEKYSKFIKN